MVMLSMPMDHTEWQGTKGQARQSTVFIVLSVKIYRCKWYRYRDRGRGRGRDRGSRDRDIL